MDPIVKYFTGEKAESYLFLFMGIVALTLAVGFLLGLKTAFWKGVAIPFLIVATLELVVGYTIVRRSPKDIVRVENYYKSDPAKITDQEIPRMEKVMSNFVLFRYLEITLIVLGIFLMYSTQKDTFLRGIGLGLFIQASIVLSLDFFAERRGKVYMDYLIESVEK
ncbi:MAG: hypothetical protein ACK5SQ_03430 [Chitinophagales bacterium]|jgi:hypothetical protein